MRHSKGFSFVEVLVVISIMAVLAGILLPVLVKSKAEAKEKQCWSNLHQLQLGLTMYRSENDGDGMFGPASQMGLPPDSVGLYKALNLPIGVYACSGAPNILSYTRAVYTQIFTDRIAGGGASDWAKYAEAVGENAVVIADMNHGDRSVPITSPFYSHRGIGVRLNGQIFVQNRTGNWSDPFWWQNP